MSRHDDYILDRARKIVAYGRDWASHDEAWTAGMIDYTRELILARMAAIEHVGGIIEDPRTPDIVAILRADNDIHARLSALFADVEL